MTTKLEQTYRSVLGAMARDLDKIAESRYGDPDDRRLAKIRANAIRWSLRQAAKAEAGKVDP